MSRNWKENSKIYQMAEFRDVKMVENHSITARNYAVTYDQTSEAVFGTFS